METQAVFDDTRSYPNKFDSVIERLLVILLVFMPLAFGARSAWSEEVVIFLSAAISICFALKFVFCPGQKMIWSWAYVPVGLLLLVVVLQLVRLPAGLVSIISPNTAAVKLKYLGDLSEANTLLKSMTLSFYPNATRHNLRLVLSVTAIFIVVVNVFRRPGQIKRLLKAIALIGGFVALIALAQDIFGNGKLYWFVHNPYPKALSGPFACHNHYGQFMNLSIGAAIGWICVKLHEDFSGGKRNTISVAEYLRSPSAKSLWLPVIIIVVGAATIFLSLSRGGMVSLLIAAGFTALLMGRRQSLKRRGWVIIVIALAAFICVLSIGFNAVYERFATLGAFDSYKSHLQILNDLTASYRRFVVFGTGLGTHAVVYPMFQNINTTLLFTHAENEYAQVMEETGLIGMALLIIFGIIIWLSYGRAIGRNKSAINSAAYGLGFGLLAVLVHSLSDFGQHIPANAFLSAIFCALLVGLERRKKNRNWQPTVHFMGSGKLRVIAFLLVFGIYIWALVGANNARIAESYWKKALDVEKSLVNKDWRGSEAQYRDLISYAVTASCYQPDNMHYQYCLNVYWWYSISKRTGSDIETIIANCSTAFVRDIIDGFNKARISCPTYGPTYSMIGQLEKFVLDDDSGAEKIRNGFYLAPCDPVACFVAGRLDILEGKVEDSILKFKKAIKVDWRLFREILDIYINYLSRPHLAISAAGDDIGRLMDVVNVFEEMEYDDLAEQAREKLRNLLEAKCTEPTVEAWVFASLGDIYSKRQNTKAAVEYYRRALLQDYSQVRWRLDLARLLAGRGQVSEAIYEAKICLRLRPQFKAARGLIEKLSVQPAAFDKWGGI